MTRSRTAPLLATLLLFPLLLSSCTFGALDPLDPPDFTPTKAPSDWTAFDKQAAHVVVPAVAKGSVPAVRLAMPDGVLPYQCLPTSDGGCLVVATKTLVVKDKNGNPQYVLRVVRFRADGSVLRDRTYDASPFNGYAYTACVFADDGFAVSVMATRAGSTQGEQASLLWRFSPEGAPLWASDEDAFEPGSLEHLFPLSDGALLAAGTIQTKLADGSYGPNDLRLMRVGPDGKVDKRVTVDSGGFDTLMDAVYSDALGLVLSWRSDAQSAGGATDRYFPMDSHLSGYDADLSQVWRTDLPDTVQLYDVRIQAGFDGIYGFGQTSRTAATDSGFSAQSSLFRFDAGGVLEWTYTSESATVWFLAATARTDGTTVLGGSRLTADEKQEAFLALISKDGALLRELEAIPGNFDWLRATKDGGFTACTRQTVRSLPPPYISSIWLDTEAIVSHYDADLHLVWRRTIDQYKHDMRGDVVVPTTQDRLLVG